MVDAPTDPRGYVLPTSATSWWADLSVVEPIPDLRYPDNLPVYAKMEDDPQVTSTVSAVTLPIRSTGWWIAPNGADSDVVQRVAENLGLPVRGFDLPAPPRMRGRFSFHEHLDRALESVNFGHAVFEQVAGIEGGRVYLRKLEERPRGTISKWNVARDGGLESIEQFELKQPIPIDRLVVYSHRRRGGAWSGRSVLNSAWKFWMLKNHMLRVQATSVDRTGVGTPVYTAAEAPLDMMADEARAFAEAQRLAGLAMAKQYRSGEESGASIPAGATLDVKGVSGNLPDPDKVIRYYDEQIGKSVLANFLSLGGENSRGSFALGSTFADFFIQSLQAEAQWIADILTQHVVEDLVDWNWGPEVRAPRVVFDDIGSKHPVTAEAITQLVNSGALQPDAEIERFLRDTYGIPQRGSAWAKGDLDNTKSRVDSFKQLIDAGASFDTAKLITGLSNLEPAPSKEQQ